MLSTTLWHPRGAQGAELSIQMSSMARVSTSALLLGSLALNRLTTAHPRATFVAKVLKYPDALMEDFGSEQYSSKWRSWNQIGLRLRSGNYLTQNVTLTKGNPRSCEHVGRTDRALAL